MRNRWYDKVLYLVISLILFFLALVFIAMPLNAVRSFIAYLMTNLSGLGLIIFLCIGVLLLVLFAYLFVGLFSKRKPQMPTSVSVKVSEIGSIDITLSALDTLILKAARSINAVKDCRAYIDPTPDGAVSILLFVALMPEANIPELTAKLQSEVQSFVESHSGVTVREVKVTVESAGVNPVSRVQ